MSRKVPVFPASTKAGVERTSKMVGTAGKDLKELC